MAEKKRQHYIPRFYMRNFADGNNTFVVYHVLQKKPIGRVPFNSQCYKDYYYGADGLWEKRLGEMEAGWGATFRAILSEKALSPEDIQMVKQFALYQRQRTLAEAEYRKQERTELIMECGKLLYAKRGWTFDDVAKRTCEERAQNECTPAENIAIVDRLIPLIDDLGVLIITYDTNSELISSDTPVIAINPFYPPSIGYACMGLILLFPISRNKLIVLFDSKMYPRFRNSLYIDSQDEDEVHNVNVLQLISAEKILFSHSGIEFSKFTDTEWKARKANRKEDTISTLGPEGNKILVSSMRKAIYDCSLSFGQICHRFKRIPFVCKEAPPRLWDDKWGNKLSIKADILSEVFKMSPELLSKHGITSKELRRGCKRMASATMAYWNQSTD